MADEKSDIESAVQNAHNLIDKDSDSALVITSRLRKDSNLLKYNDLYYRCGLIDVMALFRLGRMTESITIGERLLDRIPSGVSPRTIISLMVELSDVHHYLGRQMRCYELAFYSLKGALELKDTSVAIKALNTIGDITLQTKGPEQHYAFYDLAYRLAAETGSKYDLAVCYTSLGSHYIKEQNNDTAMMFFLKALQIYEENKFFERTAMLKIRVGRVFFNYGSLDSSRYYFQQARLDGLKHGALHAIGRSYTHQGRTELQAGNYSEAIHNIDSAIIILSKIEDLVVLNNTFRLKSQAYEKIGIFDSALTYFKEHKRLHDSLQVIKGIEDIKEMEYNYSLSSRDIDLNYLREKEQITKLRQSAEWNARLWLVVAVIVLLGIALALFRLFRQRARLLSQEKELHEKDLAQSEQEMRHEKEMIGILHESHQMELERKNKELTTLTLQMLRKSEEIAGIQDDLKNVESVINVSNNAGLDLLKRVRRISKSITHNPAQDQEWEQFKLHFEGVHTSFFERLSKQHPQLTSYDLKLCAYFHMNLGNKQVANMLNVSPDAVKKQRTRMRKKMGLSDLIDLQDHIISVTAQKKPAHI